MGTERIAVPVGENARQFKGVLKINKEGEEILNLLKDDTTEESIVSYLENKYDTDAKVIKGYVESFLKTLREGNLLIE